MIGVRHLLISIDIDSPVVLILLQADVGHKFLI